LPLLIFLHGYGAEGPAEARWLGLGDFAESHRFVFAAPNGTQDSRGKRFWNATDACCDFDGAGVDDVAYIAHLMDEAAARTRIDPGRVYVLGHSNGGFFAHRLACDLAPRIAAAVSLAGANWNDAGRCSPGRPVSVLEIHGDADAVIRMGGGRVFDLPVPTYPSAFRTVSIWAALDGCTGPPRRRASFLDFDMSVPGQETARSAFTCPPGISVELWTVAGGSHVPRPSSAALESIWTWLLAHPKPAR
jgi:polyhydroxybutyrate depolymerase